MKKGFQLLFLFTWASILWGCTPELVDSLPKLELTQTRISATDLSPRATTLSDLPDTWTPVPETETPSPSATLPIPTTTSTPSPTDDWPELCQPGEFDSYYNAWVAIADQAFVMMNEGKQLEELPKTRAAEILTEADRLESSLELLTVPPCMQNTHQQSVDALYFLERSIISLLEEDFFKAKEELQESLIALTRAIVDVGYLSTRETETHAPSQ